MEALLLENDAALLLIAAAGLAATLIAIVRDTRIRRRTMSTGVA
jgi:hypothetical protein